MTPLRRSPLSAASAGLLSLPFPRAARRQRLYWSPARRQSQLLSSLSLPRNSPLSPSPACRRRVRPPRAAARLLTPCAASPRASVAPRLTPGQGDRTPYESRYALRLKRRFSDALIVNNHATYGGHQQAYMNSSMTKKTERNIVDK